MTTPCASNPDLWFSVDPEKVEYAKNQCLTCPAIAACKLAADNEYEQRGRSVMWGVWAAKLYLPGQVPA